jgi:aerotaxis receptor
MRNNQPVTEQEILLHPKRPIVSKTDVKGQITYVNRAFIEISGFTESELIGQPHNIVRHPDMPSEAFDDMWQTLKAGHPWQGMVKNRCKNGAFYWVNAYATPLKENGQVIGYMSVRNAADTQQKIQAEQLYAAIRQKQARFPSTQNKQPWGLNRLLMLYVLPPILALCIRFIWPEGIVHDLLNLGSIIWLLLGAVLLRRSLITPLNATTAGLERLTEANFSQPFTHAGCLELQQMQESLETMRINTRALIADVVIKASDVGQASASVHEQADNLQQRSAQAQQGLTRVAAALEQLAVSVNEISSTTHEGARHAHHATQLAQQGEEDMQQTVNASRNATQEFNSTRDALALLKKSVADIGSVTSVIREIAEQTNLLALNAAIEAARAGEQGRGFAVVADEVRKLAERTTGNTQEIAQSIKLLSGQTDHVMGNIEDALNQVESIEGAVHTVSASLTAIRETSQGVASASNTIDGMLQQQSSSSTDVAQNMETMHTLTEQNSLSIGTVNQVALELHNTALDLQKLVSRFEKHL